MVVACFAIATEGVVPACSARSSFRQVSVNTPAPTDRLIIRLSERNPDASSIEHYRSPPLTLIGVAGYGSFPSRSSSPGHNTVTPTRPSWVNGIIPTVTIGSANFPENEVLADIYADALAKAGVRVVTKLDIGSREIYFKEIQNGTLNVFPEYNGALLDYLDPSSTASSSSAVTAALAGSPAADVGGIATVGRPGR